MLYSGDDDAIWLIRDSCFLATARTSSRHLAVFDLLAKLVDLGVVVLLAELLLDLAHAIAQHALAVGAARLALELGADVGLEPEHGRLALERRDDPLEALHRVGLDEQRGEVVALELEVRHRRIDELVGIDDRLDLRAGQLALGAAPCPCRARRAISLACASVTTASR